MDGVGRFHVLWCLLLMYLILLKVTRCEDDADSFVYDSGSTSNVQFSETPKMRYLLYEVNPGEGFNLRRDVYMRIANLVSHLNRVQQWTLVLPPWGGLYHWRSNIEQSAVPWATFFDLDSLRLHVPVIEFRDFLDVLGPTRCIDEVYCLQMYQEGWNGGRWEERIHKRPCINDNGFKQDASGRWKWHYWGYTDVHSEHFECVSVQMQATNLVPFLTTNTSARSVFLARAEEVIHGSYSEWSSLFWTARRSLVFAKHLQDIGNEFRRDKLQSTDKKDRTIRNVDWTKMKKQHGDAKGGPYVAVHLRRQDFLFGHGTDTPTLKEAADQISEVLKKLQLNIVFIATDAPEKEYNEIRGYLSAYDVHRFMPSSQVLETYKDGGVAIIDQWICAHARYFIGTSVSTFTFRIHEEREILGFKPDTTFNRFCSGQEQCEQPSQWNVNYG